MKLPAAAAALALALLSSPPANAAPVRTSSATPLTTTSSIGAPRRRHLQQATPADVPPPQAQLAQVCPTDSRECPGTYFAVLRNPARGCEFYPCPAPPAAVDNASPNVTSTDSQDGNDQLLVDMATLGALANVEKDAPKGGGGPQDATDDVELLAVQGDGSDLPTELVPPPVVIAEEEDAGVPVDGGLADELAAFDEALLTSTTTTANCTPCTNVPTANMLKRSYDCTTAIQALAVQCSEDDGWTASHICEYSCYKAGRGYAHNDVGKGGTRCCEVGETPQVEGVGEEAVVEEEEAEEVATPTVVETPDMVGGGVDPAEVAREEEDDNGGAQEDNEEEEQQQQQQPADAEADLTESTGAAATTEEDGDESAAADPDDVEATEGEEAEESTAMEEATEEEMEDAGDAPQPSPAEAGAAAGGDTTTNDVDVEVEDEEEEDEEGEAKPEMEVEIISESIAIVDTAPATTAEDEEDEEEEDAAEEAAAAEDETTDGVAPAEPTEPAAAEEVEETTDQDEGNDEETLLEGDGEEGDAPTTIESTEPATAEEEVESATTPPPEEATTVTAEEVISEEEDEDDMDQADTAEDEPSSPATAEDESPTIEMTTTASVAKENFDETTEPMCGVDAGGALCPFAEDGTAVYCCSKWGFCGQGVEWCGDGCQEGYGLCDSGETTQSDAETEPDTDMVGDMVGDMAGYVEGEATIMDEMTPADTTEPTDADESTGTADEVTDEIIMLEEPAKDTEDPADVMEEPTDAMDEPIADEPLAEEPPMDETTDIEDTEGDMDEAATTTPEDPIAEVEDLIPGDAVTEISREEGGTTTETSMDDVEDEEASGLRGSSVAAVQTATSSAAGVKVVASIIIAGVFTVVFGMI